MKLFATLFLSAVTTASLFAASIPRCDLTGITKEGKVKLTPGTSEGWRVTPQGWGPAETRAYRLSASATKPVGAEWTLCKFVFTPETSGNVYLSIGGQWAKNAEERGWLAVSKLSVNGTPVSNADLKKVQDKAILLSLQAVEKDDVKNTYPSILSPSLNWKRSTPLSSRSETSSPVSSLVSLMAASAFVSSISIWPPGAFI